MTAGFAALLGGLLLWLVPLAALGAFRVRDARMADRNAAREEHDAPDAG